MRNKPSYLVYMEQHVLFSRVMSVAAVVLALAVLMSKLGFGSGFFGFGVVLMCAGSLIVTLAPFRFLRWGHVAALYLGSVVFEAVIF